jgi:hypothetical protein
MEGYSSPLKGTTEFPAAGRGWEMNTGMFGTKRSTAPLLRRWIDTFIANKRMFIEAESGEQQGAYYYCYYYYCYYCYYYCYYYYYYYYYYFFFYYCYQYEACDMNQFTVLSQS